jgi:hypothetical protein
MGAPQSYAAENYKTDASIFSTHHTGTHTTGQILGNALYKNSDKGFTEVSDAMGTETYWPWGVSTGDYNADGYQDVFVSSGMGTIYRYGINSLLLNNAGNSFMDSEFLLGIEPRRDAYRPSSRCGRSEPYSSRSSVAFDIDHDGDLDIVTNQPCALPQVFVSNLAQIKRINFLKVKLVGTYSNRDGLGATVVVTTKKERYTQFNDGKSGYLSQSNLPLYFGLDTATTTQTIEVLWPSGKKTLLQNIPANQEIEIREQ